MNDTKTYDAKTTSEDAALLRDVIASFTDHPEAISIIPRKVPGALYLDVRVHGDDQGKAIGRKGAHLRALRVLMAEIGKNDERVYMLKLEDPGEEIRKIETPPKHAEGYDPERARALLARTVAYVAEEETKVDVKPIMTGGFLFSVVIRSPVDLARFSRVYEGTDGITLTSILETIWKAYANKEGTQFRIECKAEA